METTNYSIVVPLYNEQDNVLPLYSRILEAMTMVSGTYEIVFVDDGSRDNTFKVLSEISAIDSRITVVRLRKNFGDSDQEPGAAERQIELRSLANYHGCAGSDLYQIPAGLFDETVAAFRQLGIAEHGGGWPRGWISAVAKIRLRRRRHDRARPFVVYLRASDRLRDSAYIPGSCGRSARTYVLRKPAQTHLLGARSEAVTHLRRLRITRW